MTTEVRRRRPLLCALNVRHVWLIASTEDGTRFRRCARCGKVDDPSRNGSWASPWGGL